MSWRAGIRTGVGLAAAGMCATNSAVAESGFVSQSRLPIDLTRDHDFAPKACVMVCARSCSM